MTSGRVTHFSSAVTTLFSTHAPPTSEALLHALEKDILLSLGLSGLPPEACATILESLATFCQEPEQW